MKHVEQFIEINRSRKLCILLVVLIDTSYTSDAQTYERQFSVEFRRCTDPLIAKQEYSHYFIVNFISGRSQARKIIRCINYLGKE